MVSYRTYLGIGRLTAVVVLRAPEEYSYIHCCSVVRQQEQRVDLPGVSCTCTAVVECVKLRVTYGTYCPRPQQAHQSKQSGRPRRPFYLSFPKNLPPVDQLNQFGVVLAERSNRITKRADSRAAPPAPEL